MTVGPIFRRVLRSGIRYAPVVYGVVKDQNLGVGAAIDRSKARQEARQMARRHASAVVDGSVLEVIRKGELHWVVFSGDDAVDVYPDVPADELHDMLRFADYARRKHPADMGARAAVRRAGAKAAGRARGAAASAGRKAGDAASGAVERARGWTRRKD